MSTADSEKVKAYFDEIDDHVIRVIKDKSVSNSCFATLFLVFAAADGLGKLTHPYPNAGAGERFRFFVSKLGKKYEDRKEKLWALRNDLFHNGLNVNVFLSMTEIGQEHHLEDVDAPGKIYVNTSLLFGDFRRVFNSEKQRIMNDTSALSQASERLEWCSDVEQSFDYPTTPPPPIEFVVTK